MDWIRKAAGSEVVTFVDNHTPFSSELFSFPDLDGQEAQVLVVRATYRKGSTDQLEVVPEQLPIQIADEHFGDPALSSVRYEADVAIEKARVDVIVNGTAYAPKDRATQQVIVKLEVGDIEKTVRVIGDRYRSVLGLSIPEPFISMPLIYERAYGGSDTSDANPRNHYVCKTNPVGLGFRNALSQSRDILTEQPNLGFLTSGKETEPAGFGIIARSWSPRIEFAGTFDEEWRTYRWPLMPRNFDLRHYQIAPLDQQTNLLQTATPVRLTNFTPDGAWEFALPPAELPVYLVSNFDVLEAYPRMDTVLIEPDLGQVSLTFRLKLTLERGRQHLREIVIGPMTRGMLLAKERQKPFIEMRDLGKRKSEGQ